MPCFLFNNITGGELPPKPGLGCACKRQSPVSWLPVPSGPGQRSRSRDATLPPLPRDPGPHLAVSGEEAVAGPGWRCAGEAVSLRFWPDYTPTDPHPCRRKKSHRSVLCRQPECSCGSSHFGNYPPLGKAALALGGMPVNVSGKGKPQTRSVYFLCLLLTQSRGDLSSAPTVF